MTDSASKRDFNNDVVPVDVVDDSPFVTDNPPNSRDVNGNGNRDGDGESNWPKSPNTGCRNAMIGCGVAAVLMLIVAIGVGIIAVMKWRTWTADFTQSLAEEAIAKSELPPEGKERLRKRFQLLAEDFKAGRLTGDQLGRIVENVGKSPLLVIALANAAEEKYIKPSGLSDEDKQAGHRTLERFARGLFENRIGSEQQQAVMNVVMEKINEHQQRLKEKLTDDEVREFLAKAKSAADAATIPDEPFTVDVAAEIEQAIDRALKP